MEVKIYESITEIDEKEWDAIVGRDRIICTHRYLEAIEKASINDCQYYYPVVYEGKNIIAHACVYSISTELDVFAKGLIKKFITWIRKIWKNFLILKSLECGTPVALGNTISLSGGAESESALILIIEALEKLAKKRGIEVILLRDFYCHDLHFYDCLEAYGFKKVNNLPNTILEVRWETFGEYLESLKSHYRCKIKKNMFVAQKKGVNEEIRDEFSSLSANLQMLWQNVYDQAKDYRREILTESFFVNMDKYLGNGSKMFLFKTDSTTRGFALALMDDDTLRYMFTGIDYSVNKDHYVYLNSLYSVIKLAIKEKKKAIEMGITAYFPKTDVGAKLVNLYMYLKHLNPILHPIIAFAWKKMTPQVESRSKYIFKR